MELFNFLLGILPGSITCFLGLKMRKIALALSWFIVGYYILGFFIEHFAINEILKFVLQIGLGIILSLLSLKLQKIGWFILVFAIGFSMIFISLPENWSSLIIAIVVGLIFGILAFHLYETMIAISTALGGAYSIALSVTNYFNLNNITYFIIIFTLLGLAGLYVQLSSLKKEKNK